MLPGPPRSSSTVPRGVLIIPWDDGHTSEYPLAGPARGLPVRGVPRRA